MSQWRDIKLKDLCEKVTVGFVGPMAHEYQETGITFLRSLNIKPFRLELTDVKFVSEEFHRKIRKSALHPGDVAVVRTGYPGTAAVVPKSLPISNCSDLVIVRPSKDLNPHFITAIFNSTFGQTLVSGNTVGAAQQHFNITTAKELKFLVPPRQVQDKIAAVLSAYDELIENNRRRIALLEKLAEEVYREWFVRLRFPGHEKVKLVKGVPEGWTRDAVSSFTVILRRGVAPVYDENGEGLAINQKCIRGGKLSLVHARKQSREVAEARYVQVGDVLVNSTGEGTLGRVAQVLTPVDRAIVDSHVTIVRPKTEVPMHYFGMTLRGWEPHLSIMGQGSTNQTELSPTTIGRLSILMPPQKLGERFEELVSPVFKQSEILRHQTEALRQTRDLLLPRLIAGKLSVEHLDIQFPPGMVEEKPAGS